MSVAEQQVGKPAVSLKDSDFKWEDPLDLESELSEEERMVRDTARGYAQDKLFPQILKAYREERFDRSVISDMGALGLLGPTIPEEYGGAGLGYVAAGLITRELERLSTSDDAAARAWRAALEADYDYEGIATCSRDSMCSTSCPVHIDTGALVKETLVARHPPGQRRWAVTEGMAERTP